MSTMLALRRRARNLVVSILTAVVLTTSVLVPASASTRREPGRAARGVPANNALDLDGTNDYVTFGAAPGLGAATFTLELWFRREGVGVGTSTGAGGIASAVPLVTKGRAQADGSNQDMNYFLGIDTATNVLVADFEEGAGGASPGLNHPISGTTPICNNGSWYHAAATYDGTKWSLYLNGALEAESDAINQPPRSDSIQHAAIGSALTSTGVAAGFFNGVVDEVRIWNLARTGAEIAQGLEIAIQSAPGLIGRWGLDEGAGTVAADSSGSGINGTLTPAANPPVWVLGTPFAVSTPPAGNYALDLGGASDYVTFGAAPGLGAATFTLELWFRRDGVGVATSTGTGGLASAVPLLTKGRGEADGDNRDMNYFLGINPSTNVLVADFEEGAGGASPGLNHPVSGTTPIANDTWYHAAATYDGTKWSLYLDGQLEVESASIGQPPRSDSIQHAAIGSALTSTGVAAGFFNGVVDEVRIWNLARTGAEIANDRQLEIPSAPGLVGRWSLNENCGSTAEGTAGVTPVDGAITGTGWVWTTGSPGINTPPVVDAGGDQTITLPADASLDGSASDDGLPSPPGALTTTWSTVSGPGTVTFGDASALSTTASFSTDGVYVLNLAAFDGAATSHDQVTITVNPSGPVNQAPMVDAGPDQTIVLPSDASLSGTVTDDGLPVAPGAFTTLWTKESGPGTVMFADASAQSTTASFSAPGEYVLRLTADDGALSSFDEVTITVDPEPGNYALDLGASNAYVAFGNPAKLHLAAFTLELKFKREGTGTTTTTGTGGIASAIPLLTRGRGEAENGNVDMNYFLGIDSATGVLVADFEEGAAGSSPSQNHPVLGQTAVTSNVWHHAAATYDGTTWRLYLDGVLERELVVGEPAAAAGNQHAALGSALTSTGAAQGFFDGSVDEARVWNRALTQSELRSTINQQITGASGLVARWGLDDGMGTTVADSVAPPANGTITGTGSSWVAGAPAINLAPVVNAGADQAVTLPASASLTGIASDDGLPNPPATLTTTWSKVSGPGTVTFGNASALSTTASFSVDGTYVLRLTANDGALSSFDDVTITANSMASNAGLDLGGTNAYVAFGNPAKLHLAAFTIETWFKREGAGTTTMTGTGGINAAVPLLTRGRGETENPDVDLNYFLGIDSATGVLVADFEEGAAGSSPSQNHPVFGQTAVTSNVWHHAAATYDGATWRLYLDGVLERELVVGEPAAAAGNQHAALGSALASTGAAQGFFDGVLDEARIWNRALTESELRANVNLEITGASGLVARWGLNEGTGTTVADSTATPANGTITGTAWSWGMGAPFNLVFQGEPNAPVLISPADGATGVSTSPSLDVSVSDPDDDDLTVTYYGREVTAGPPGPDFTIVALPDTQYYSSSLNGGSPTIFNAQTQWIVDNKAARNIVFVTQLGDCVENGDNNGNPVEWNVANGAMSRLEDPVTTMLPEGIPFGIAVGNHDQSPAGNPNGTTTFYNQFFGEARFAGRAYYGGHFGTNNDNHYQLFSASGLDFIVIHLEYDTSASATVLSWANALLQTHSNRRAIVVSHWFMNTGTQGSFGAQGQATYNALRGNPNLFLMLCGHVPGEGRRVDTFNGNTVHTVLSDYQSRTNGGNGWLRIMTFSPANDQIQVTTYSPTLNQFETDADSQFTLAYDMESSGGGPFNLIATNANVPSGSSTSATWPGLEEGKQYEWYVTVSDGVNTTTGPTWRFTTLSPNNMAPTVDAGDDQSIVLPASASLAGMASDDGLPNPPATLTTTWSKVSGPGTVTFGNASALSTTASFSVDGTYVLRLTASDSALSTFDDVAVDVDPAPPGQGIAFRSASSATNAASQASAQLAIPAPAGVQAGDLLLASIDVRGAATVTAPAGWTLVRTTAVVGDALHKQTYYRVAGAGEPSSYTWTFSEGRVASGGILAYSGVDTTSPIEAHSGQANAASASLTAPSVTTVTNGAVVVALYGFEVSAAITPPAGMTERFEVQQATGKPKVTSEAADEVRGAAGATGPRVATAGASGKSVGQLVALRPAP